MIDSYKITNFSDNKITFGNVIKCFIYVMNNEDFKSRNRIKYGYSKYSEDYETLINRLHDNDTHHTEYCEYIKIYEFVFVSSIFFVSVFK